MSDVTMIVVFSLAAAVAVVLYAWYLTGEGAGVLTKTIPGRGKWDFSESWGSNLTLVGGILATTLSSGVIPDTFTTVVLPSATDYVALSILFVIVVVVAPFVNSAFILRHDLNSENDRGRGWAVLLACCLTLWGVIGQLGTIGLLFYEVKRAHLIAPGATVFLWVVIGAAIVLVVPYTIETIAVIVKAERRRSQRRVRRDVELFTDVIPAPAPSAGWSLL